MLRKFLKAIFAASTGGSHTRLRVGVAASLTLWCLGLLASPALAQRKLLPARLLFEVADDAKDCPDKAAFLKGVMARAGEDPFVGDTAVVVLVRLERHGDGFAASIELMRTGESLGLRTVTSDSCSTVARAAELVAMLMLREAEAETGPASEPILRAEVKKLQRPTGITDLEVASTTPPKRRHQVSVEILARLGGSVGILPAASETVAGGTQLRWGAWSFGAEAAWHRAALAPLADGQIAASLYAGELSSCRRFQTLGICGFLRAGMMRSEGRNYSTNLRAATPHAALGPRLTWDYGLTDRLALRSSVALAGTLIRSGLQVTGSPMEEWKAPLASSELGIAISGRLW